jgi:hypothetical protein
VTRGGDSGETDTADIIGHGLSMILEVIKSEDHGDHVEKRILVYKIWCHVTSKYI